MIHQSRNFILPLCPWKLDSVGQIGDGHARVPRLDLEDPSDGDRRDDLLEKTKVAVLLRQPRSSLGLYHSRRTHILEFFGRDRTPYSHPLFLDERLGELDILLCILLDHASYDASRILGECYKLSDQLQPLFSTLQDDIAYFAVVHKTAQDGAFSASQLDRRSSGRRNRDALQVLAI